MDTGNELLYIFLYLSSINTFVFTNPMYNTMLICLAQGFTAHRNTEGATSFMVDKLYFPSKAEAQIVRDEYFKRYHSTAKVCDVLQKT